MSTINFKTPKNEQEEIKFDKQYKAYLSSQKREKLRTRLMFLNLFVVVFGLIGMFLFVLIAAAISPFSK